MHRHLVTFTCAAAVAAAALAGSLQLPSPAEIHTAAESLGVDFAGARTSPIGGLTAGGACFGGGQAEIVVLPEPVGDDSAFLRDTAYVCSDLGTFWVVRDDSRILALIRRWVGPFPLYGVAGQTGMSRWIVNDLDAREVDFHADGAAAPAAGPRGETLPSPENGAVLVGLEAPEPGSADMFTDLAWIDPSSGLYWAHRSGGFAGVSLWVGPFPARIVTDEGPTEVRPARARTPRRTRRRNLLIRRDIASAQENPRVRRRDYAPEDFDFGQGIRVVRVLRANRRLIRVRIEISSDAVPGQRAVLVKGALGDALFTLE